MAQSIDVVAPVPGLVASVAVAAGARVAAGDPVVILQAMKMEIVVARRRGRSRRGPGEGPHGVGPR